MEPFPLFSDADKLLTERYPPSQEFAQACNLLHRDAQLGVLRSFVAEGVPCAFSHVPTLYETTRQDLASSLALNPKDVTLVGSARLGYSLAPPPCYGSSFKSSSDLDFAVVCDSLFQSLVDAFRLWEADVSAGRERVRGVREEKFWKENLQRLPRNIRCGFIDSSKVPNRYSAVMRVNQTCWLVKEKLRLTDRRLVVRWVSVRVYQDWDAFFRQQLLNLRHTLAGFGEKVISDMSLPGASHD